MRPTLCLDGVDLRYNERPVLSDLCLSVESGETLALLGPSGCGKTTVLRLLLGLSVPDQGRVQLGDVTVSEPGRLLVSPRDRRLAVVFQDLALWPHLTVRGNLRFGLDARGVVPRQERDERVRAVLARLGLAGKGSRYPGQLSGGERQRVAIARALVLEPQAILLDEPLSSLDVTLRRELLALLHELFREHSSTVLYVTHDLREAASLGDRIAVMEAGSVVQLGTLDELREEQATPFVRGLVRDLQRWEPIR